MDGLASSADTVHGTDANVGLHVDGAIQNRIRNEGIQDEMVVENLKDRGALEDPNTRGLKAVPQKALPVVRAHTENHTRVCAETSLRTHHSVELRTAYTTPKILPFARARARAQ